MKNFNHQVSCSLNTASLSSYAIVLVLFFVQCASSKYDLSTAACAAEESGTYAQSTSVKAVMNKLTEKIPGAAIAVLSEDGLWQYSTGYAKIETKTSMKSCHLQYLQSIAKTYTAVCMLMLVERGTVNLKSPITAYLPPVYSQYISRAKEITVEMLLNHTSGIPEYNNAPTYITRLLQDPGYPFQPADYLKYIKGKSLDFEPGSKYSYRNTNYVLAALILDALTSNHGAFMQKEIFDRLDLKQTYYYASAGYLDYPEVVNSYWDRYSNGRIENVSILQRNNVRAMIGDDGIVSTPGDAVQFLKGLMDGKLISREMLGQMKTWVNDTAGNATYGLGLDHAMIGNMEGWGHSGGGIGAGCQLYYIPDKNLYYFIGINLGTVTESPIHQDVERSLQSLAEIFQR
jgi:D-alanyl-D-alanine carboxypeptidase